jgi:hypothetical protein
MLAYNVEWHMHKAWRKLMFADDEQAAKTTRDPVAPTTRSTTVEREAAARTLDDGTPAHNFATLLAELSTIVRGTFRAPRATLNDSPDHHRPQSKATTRPAVDAADAGVAST